LIDRLVIFGGTGDLAGRFLLPALATLQARGHLSERFELVGASRENWDDEQFRSWAAGWLEREAGDIDGDATAAVVRSSRYERIDLADPAAVAECLAGEGPVAVYLALPPAVFPTAIVALQQAGLPDDSQVVVEKPFGEDLESARALNRLLAEVVDEHHVFRVDHFLAMTTVQNVLATRLGDSVLEALWNSAHVDEVEIAWDETLALEGRAGYYDHVGALKDMVQNHLLQVLCLVAMEPPDSAGEPDPRDRKVDVLRSVRRFEDADVASHTRRARYRAGRVGDRDIPAYVDEEGVTSENGTETFAEVTLSLDSPRWSGTSFRLRTGKALARDRKEVVVHFENAEAPVPNPLRFELEPEELPPSEHAAYERILLDVLNRDTALSVRGDEAEEAWRVVTPVLDGWSRNLAPLEEYDAGALEGPVERQGYNA
jgi:glucose-6-phosphate 1-dehydrogenase